MIQRIPASLFQYNQFQDQDIINAFNWFKSFISEKEWSERKKRTV